MNLIGDDQSENGGDAGNGISLVSGREVFAATDEVVTHTSDGARHGFKGPTFTVRAPKLVIRVDNAQGRQYLRVDNTSGSTMPQGRQYLRVDDTSGVDDAAVGLDRLQVAKQPILFAVEAGSEVQHIGVAALTSIAKG